MEGYCLGKGYYEEMFCDTILNLDEWFMKRSSLQCYSILSTVAQVLRKMSLKILAS